MNQNRIGWPCPNRVRTRIGCNQTQTWLKSLYYTNKKEERATLAKPAPNVLKLPYRFDILLKYVSKFELKMETNFVIYLALGALLCLSKVQAEIVNLNVERSLDLTSQLVRATTKITAEDTAGKPISEYVFFVGQPSLAYISVKDNADKNVQIRRNELAKGEESYTLTFPKAASKQTFVVETVSSKNILPHPLEIRQNDKQFVKYIGHLHFYSKYKTNSQKTSAKLSSSNILSHTQVKPFSVASSKITFGPYENVEGNELKVHFK